MNKLLPYIQQSTYFSIFYAPTPSILYLLPFSLRMLKEYPPDKKKCTPKTESLSND